MDHYIYPVVEVTDSLVTFESLRMKANLQDEDMQNIKSSNVLLVAEENFRDRKGKFYPENTFEFYKFLLDKTQNTKLKVDICCSDDEYCEVQLHNDIIRIVELIVEEPFYDILIGIISSYLFTKIMAMRKSKKDVQTEITVNVEKKGKTKKIHYVGSSEDFEKTMLKEVKKLLDDD